MGAIRQITMSPCSCPVTPRECNGNLTFLTPQKAPIVVEKTEPLPAIYLICPAAMADTRRQGAGFLRRNSG